jgi:two-component system, NtrC family, nitrogen regulation sensor histidine kinase NtrY
MPINRNNNQRILYNAFMKAIQQYIILGIGIALLSITFLWDNANQRSEDLSYFVQQIETYIKDNEKKVIRTFNDAELLQRLISNEYTEKDWSNFEKLHQEAYSIYIYKDTLFKFWSTNTVIPAEEEMLPTTSRSMKLVKYNTSWYELIKETKKINKENYTLVGLIPIYYQYDIENENVEDHFALSYDIPKTIRITEKPNNYPIKNSAGEDLCYLEHDGSFVDSTTILILMMLYVLGFIFLSAFINLVSTKLAEERTPLIGFIFLALSLFFARTVTLIQPYDTIFTHIELFQGSEFIAPIISNSVMGLLINSVLMLWVIAFLFRKVPLKNPKNYTDKEAYIIVFGGYLLVFLSFIWFNNIIRDLIIKSNISLEFDNIFRLDAYSYLGLISIFLLVFSLVLFSYKVISNAIQSSITNKDKLKAGAILLVIVLALILLGQANWNVFFLSCFIIYYIALFERFAKEKTTGLQWIGVWLFTFSVLIAGLILYFNHYKEQLHRIDFAERVFTQRDREAEKQFEEIQRQILTEDLVKNIANPLIPRYVIEDAITDVHRKNSYLLENYDLSSHFFNRAGKGRKGEKTSFEELSKMIEESDSTLSKNLFFWKEANNEKYCYLAQLNIKDNDRNLGSIILKYSPKDLEETDAYPELLTDRSLSSASVDYDFAIYKNGKATKNQDGKYPTKLEFAPPNKVKSYYFTSKDNRSYLVYKATEDQTVIVGKDKATNLRPISLFSYIFAFLSLLLFLIVNVNKAIGLAPNTLTFSPQASLRSRIQTSIITVIVITFLTIGLVTFFYFRADSDEYHSSRLSRKASTVMALTNYWMATNAKDSTYMLDIEALAEINSLDVNFFDAKGSLVTSSQPKIFNKGLLAPKMAPKAYYSMMQKGITEFTGQEIIGKLEFNVAYRAVKNTQEELIGFLGMPYYSEKSDFNEDIAAFIGTLLNVYVALLIIAFVAAFLTANSITRPLSQLRDKLRAVELDKKNEALKWETKDEIGDLIEEYNKMLLELERSASKLASSEREGAWREMAKQVAHEIKNPLTPMKLSIQYLNHAYQSRPEAIGSMLKRVSSTLIEQIDGLARIATEFSNFATMPSAENEFIVINGIVKNVYSLFSKNDGVDMELAMTEAEYTVFADKEQIVRVLNNIVKNAIQAIPDDRRGSIKIAIKEEHGEFVLIDVKDNGCGIPEDKANSVFVPNFTTKSSGTGLGLAISRKIIEQAGGTITFVSQENVGTTFSVRLPIQNPTDGVEVISSADLEAQQTVHDYIRMRTAERERQEEEEEED